MHKRDLDALERVSKWCDGESLSVIKSDVRVVVDMAKEAVGMILLAEGMMEKLKNQPVEQERSESL